MTLSSASYRHDDVFLQEHSSAGVGGGQESFLAAKFFDSKSSTARKRREKDGAHAVLFLLLIAPCFFLAEDAGENLVDVFQLAVEIEGVFDLFARDFGGDFLVGEDQVVEV